MVLAQTVDGVLQSREQVTVFVIVPGGSDAADTEVSSAVDLTQLPWLTFDYIRQEVVLFGQPIAFSRLKPRGLKLLQVLADYAPRK